MHYAAAYAWLVGNGLWRDLLAALIGLTVTRAAAWGPLKHLRALAAENAARQDRIADLLDTSTPGGLHEVKALLEHQAPLSPHHEAPAPPPPHHS